MSYIFPRRVLRPSDVLDPIELTLDFSPAAERLSGHINAHNINDDIAGVVPVASDAFYTRAHYSQTAYFAIPQPPAAGMPDDDPTPLNAYQVQNNFAWQTITNDAGAPAQITLATGNSVLWVNAYAAYLWQGFSYNRFFPTAAYGAPIFEQHKFGAMYSPANVQFAIRVDGAIIEETVTGIAQEGYQPSVAIKPLDFKQYGDLPGPQDIRCDPVESLGPPCLPTRLGACVPVQAGDHIIELVVRRTPEIKRVGTVLQSRVYEPGDNVYVFHRQLHVVDLKSFPVDSTTAADVSVPSFEEEDTLNQTSLYTDRYQKLVTGYNAVQEGNLARGALTHDHLAPVLPGAAKQEVVFAQPVLFNNYHPGSTLDTVTLTRYAGTPAVGWTLLTDGSNPIRLGGFTPTANSRVLILANCQLRNVAGELYRPIGNPDDETFAYNGNFAIFSAFSIMSQPVGAAATAWSLVYPSEGIVNNFVWWPAKRWLPKTDVSYADAEFGLENVEIALMAEISVPANTSVNIGMFGALINPRDAFTFNNYYEVTRGSIMAIALPS